MLRLLAKTLLAIVALAAVLLLVARGVLELPAARSRGAALLERLLARDNLEVTIQGLGGSLPFAPTVERIEIADRGGVWLTIENASADLASLELIRRRAHLRSITAERVTMLRRPLPGDDPFRLKPYRLVTVVDRLEARELRLGRGVFGSPHAPEWLGPLELSAKGTVDLRRLTLDASLSAHASRAGALVVEPDVRAGRTKLTVTARGAIQAPSGELSLEASDVTVEDVKLAGIALHTTVERLGMGERRYRLMVSGNGRSLSGLPDPLASVIGADPSISASVRFGATPRTFDIDALTIAAGTFAADLAASGSAQGRIDVSHAAVTWPDLAAVPAVAKWVTGGTLRLRGKGGAVLAGGELRDVRAELVGKGESISFADPRLQALAGPEPSLGVTFTSDSGSVWNAESLTLAGASVQAGGSGSFDATAENGSVEMDVALSDLAALGGAGGTPAITGAVRAEIVGGGTRDALDGTVVLRPEGVVIGAGGPIAGTLTVALEGSFAAPRARLDATLDVAGTPLTASGRGVYARDEHALAIEMLELSTAAGKAEASGEVLTDAGLASGKATLAIADLAKLTPFLGVEAAGSAAAEVDLTHARGVQRARFSARAEALRIVGLGAGALAAATAEVRGEIVDPLGRLDGSLDASVTGATWRDASADALDIRIDRSGGKARFRANAVGSFRGPFEAHAEGHHTGTRAASTIVLDRLEGSVRGHAFHNSGPLELATRGGQVAVRELALTVGSGSVEGSWGYGGSRGIGHVRATDLPLDLAALVSEKLLLGGRVSGELARRSRGEDLAVALRTEDAEIVTSGGARSAHGFEVDLTASAGAWKSHVTGKVTAATNDSTLDVDAELPFGFVGGTTRGDLRGRVTGTLDANLIDDLVLPDNERLAGRLDVDLALAGSLEAPRADGRIAGALAYTSGATGMTLRLEEIQLAASGGRIDVVRLRGTDGRQGRLEGTGTVLLATRDAPTRFDLRASFTDTYVARLDEVELRGSGALALSGPADALALTGNFRSDEATIRIPDRLPPDVATLPVEHVNLAASRRAVEEPAARTPREPILLDVEIAFPSRLRVEDPNLDSEWRGTLYVRGNTSKPDIQGELQVVRGRFELAGIRFTADEGRLTFDGDTNVPMLDVVAEASRNDIEATLRLQGPANAPVVTLTSTPALPQDEILSRLMFGETAGTLTPGQSIQLAQAAARLSGGGQGIGSAVLRRIRRLAGVDRIEIRDSGDPENAGTAVSVGKYLGDRVYLSYDQAVHGQGSKARVEVEMTKHLSVETEVGQSENASVGFRWRWNY